MKKKNFTLLLVCIPLLVSAQKSIYGTVLNSFTRQPVLGTKIEVLTIDSIVVNSVIFSEGLECSPYNPAWSISVKENGQYILRFSAEGHETVYTPLTLKLKGRDTRYDFGRALLKRLPKERKLGEAVVKATRVKFYNKGDTVVYNADAFQLSEGSMLDALISQLPGVELKDDGRIFVNGKHVENLLLNGKDFFKGDNNIMLENLPSYMVKEVKVYDRKTMLSEFVGRDVESKQLTMDINLKRQYSIGWIANAEGGIGTENKYLGRMFALRFSPQSRLAFFGNMNNLNDSREPGKNGEWEPSDIGNGLRATKKFGIDYNVENKYNKNTIEGNATIEHSDDDYKSTTAGVNFLAGGDTYSRSRSSSLGCNTVFNTNHKIVVRSMRGMLTFLTPELQYHQYRNRSAFLSGDFNSDPSALIPNGILDSLYLPNAGAALRRIIINRNLQNSMFEGHSLNTSFSLTSFIKIPHSPNSLSVRASANYNEQENKQYTHYSLSYPSSNGLTDFRNQYTTNPNSGYNIKAGGNYMINTIFPEGSGLCLIVRYEYEQSYRSVERSLYRLDQLEGWGEDSEHQLGTLPSVTENMMQTLDNNSYHSRQTNFNHNTGLELQWSRKLKSGGSVQVHVPMDLTFERNKLNYTRKMGIDTLFYRNEALFSPKLRIQYLSRDYSKSVRLNYNSEMNSPSMTSLLNIRDDANPLYVSLGNPNLRNSWWHRINLELNRRNNEKQRSFNVNLNYIITQDAIAIGYVYDKQTGVRTTRPENVNGNWEANGTINYNFSPDKAHRLSITTSTNSSYYNSVDLTGIDGAATSRRSIVRSLYLSENIRADYRIKKTKIGAKIGGTWVNVTSRREDFSPINAGDFNYGLTGQVELPWSMQVSTDLTVYSRRGYEDKAMNTNDFVWNARLSKRVMKGNLTFILDGFDILGNLSNITHTINTQGRTETYRNVIPSYVMLRAVYRLNIQPKKRPGE